MTGQTPNNASTFAVSDTYRNYVLFILFVVYGLSYVDRQILSILMEPIRKEFNFGDIELGLLSGVAFAIFYATLGIPIARFADRYSRINIIAASLLIWSAATALTGKAMSFGQLFLARIGVGVGEAGCNPSAYSIISDYFPLKHRATAQSVYSLGVYLGQFSGSSRPASLRTIRLADCVLCGRFAGYCDGGDREVHVARAAARIFRARGLRAGEPPPAMAVFAEFVSLPSF